MPTFNSSGEKEGHVTKPLGVVEGGLALSKDEGRLKKLARRKRKGIFPITSNFSLTIGIRELRVDRPSNRVS